ncbi:cupin-like domain-containing protein [Nocardioides currus]|uniref:Cupin-like domain-containing protein n=1 Tax=Nocardioides currus TaxID=2133958 RepID=A0A2R7YV86_9ACTN|nr:cupin-like domain-containing protein [Nocardioides currus]PUA80285.1 cupin-like domain-containing protein [Nocardioides currus]
MDSDTQTVATDSPYLRSDEFRRWLAYTLLGGFDPAALAHEVVRQTGEPLHLVEAEIALAQASPYLQGAAPIRERLTKTRWVLHNRARLAALVPDALTVPVLDRPDPDDVLRHHYAAHRPAVLRGLVDDWAARSSWTLDGIAERLGDTPVRVQWNRESIPDYEVQSPSLRTSRPFSEIAERLRNPEPTNDFYVTANNAEDNREAFEPLREDVGEIPGILAPGSPRDGFIWIGPRGTVTPWHHDLTNNLLLQLQGRKRVRLVASHDTPLMRNSQHCYSDWTTADLPAGPAHDDRPAVHEVTIGPGEALFIPVGWWHHVEGLDQTIGMSFTGFVWDNDFYSGYTTFGEL